MNPAAAPEALRACSGRGQFLARAPAFLAGAAILPACSGAPDPDSYESVAVQTWRLGSGIGFQGAGPSQGVTRELVRFATLAPSSHNTQCWKLALEEGGVTILPDLSRRCPSVDPDDHHVFVSLGCAAENLTHAALAHGLQAEARFDTPRDVVHIALTPTAARSSPLFNAITSRQCTRGDYDGKPLSARSLLCSNVRARRRVSACCC